MMTGPSLRRWSPRSMRVKITLAVMATLVVMKLLFRVFAGGSTNLLDLTSLYRHHVEHFQTHSHDKWIVLDSASRSDCKQSLQRAPPGWKILLITDTDSLLGDCKKTAECTVFQPILGSDVEKETRRILQKNLAYLLAVSRGAAFILDADCSVSLPDAVKVVQFSSDREHGLMYNETHLFNPYSYFGAWDAVPQALDGKRNVKENDRNSRLYYVRDFDNVLVKHGLINTSLDLLLGWSSRGPIEPTMRLGREHPGSTFDPSAPPVFVGQKSFTPVIPACSLYRKESFWGLLIPCVSTELRCQLLRQLLSQRLFRELDAFSGFYQLPSSSEPIVRHQTYSDTADGLDTRALARELDSWSCEAHYTFFACFKNITDHLLDMRYISHQENALVKSWISVIEKVSFVEPSRVSSPWRGVRRTSECKVVLGSVRTSLESEGPQQELQLRKQLIQPVKTQCNRAVVSISSTVTTERDWFSAEQWKSPPIHDIALVVQFNEDEYFWKNLPYLEAIHRPFFKHIFYCLTDVDKLVPEGKNWTESLPKHISMVEGQSDNWFLMYGCVAAVAQMQLGGVEGYLHVGDDTLLNSWVLPNAPRNTFWTYKEYPPDPYSLREPNWGGWIWWERGRVDLLKTLAGLERISQAISPKKQLDLDASERNTHQNESFHGMKRHDPASHGEAPSNHSAVIFSQIFNEGNFSIEYLNSPLLPGSEAWQEPSPEAAKRFLTTYNSVNKMAGQARRNAGDFFYVPQTLANDFVTFSRYFMKHHVMIELAMPAIRHGLASRDEMLIAPGSELWGGMRTNLLSYYNHTHFFLHPFKFVGNLKQDDLRAFFCEEYMERLFCCARHRDFVKEFNSKALC